jgi:hypothetical protein
MSCYGFPWACILANAATIAQLSLGRLLVLQSFFNFFD